jgi:flagellar basal-body rod protein FlgG
MFDAMYIGATGMRSEQLQIDTIAHNLANMNTIGFRRGVASFSEVSAAIAAGADPAATVSQAVRSALRGAGVTTDVTLSSVAGELRQTGEALDVAIDGAGFLEVLRADGTPAYTRAGKLHVNADGLLATADGSPLSARIEAPTDAREIRISADGRVSVIVGDGAEPVEIGQIELTTFANPAALRAAGSGLYVADGAAGAPQIGTPGEFGLGTLRQGFVEASNVQMADELVSMMLAQRAFELNARVVQAADQMLSITNSLYR